MGSTIGKSSSKAGGKQDNHKTEGELATGEGAAGEISRMWVDADLVEETRQTGPVNAKRIGSRREGDRRVKYT